MFVVARIKPRELEHQQADIFCGLTHIGFQERPLKQISVKEMFVGFAGALAEVWQIGKLLDGDGIRHLEREFENLPAPVRPKPARYFSSGNL